MKDITKNSSSYITRGLSFNSASRGATLNSRSNLHSDTFSGEALQLRSHSLDPQKPTALRGTFRGSPPHYNLGGAWVKKKMKKNKINVKNGLLNSCEIKKHVLEVCFFSCFHSSSWFQWLVPLLLIVGFSEPLRLRGAEWHTHTWETTSHTQDLKTLEWDSSAVTKTLKFLHLIDSWRSANFFNTFPSFQTRQSNSLGRLFNPSYPPTNFFCL